MRALVVYESMYGNTHEIAEHIALGLGSQLEVTVVPVEGATADSVAAADLLVVGGPTHAHTMSSTSTRKAAVESVQKKPDLPPLDPDAEGPGLRDWFQALAAGNGRPAAAYDTRFDAAAVLTGRASKGIAKRLRSHGYRLVDEPTSFLVDRATHLLDGEAKRAEVWGEALAQAMVGVAS